MAVSQSLEKLFLEAQLLQQDDKITEAIKIYQQILQADPLHHAAMRYLALSYVQNNQIDLSIETFLKAIAQQPDPILHMNLANVYKKINKFAEAIQHFEKAIKIKPDYAKAHNNLAGLYADTDEFSKSLYHYKEALHADPGFTLAHLNLGILFFKNQEVAPAITQFNNVLAIDENNISALFYLGLLNLADDHLDKAREFFEEVFTINSEHVESIVNLGVIALKQKKPQVAIDYFTKALAIDENNLEARNNLAATFVHNDRYENALKYYENLLKEDPLNVEYLYNTGVAQMGLGHIEVAIKMFTKVLDIQGEHFGALSNLAAIKMRNNEKPRAIELLQRALKVEPNNKTTQFMLQALMQKQEQVTTCTDYARDLFNHYAMYYEKHMQETLQYKLPEKLWEILNMLKLESFDKILDLGCGTGLCGDVLKSFTNDLIGVDIADKMLSVARAKGIYTKLISADIFAFLAEDTENYDLIVAADVLPYFGSLDSLFASIQARLCDKGIFIFSTEISSQEQWQVQESIRFSHSPHYISKLCDANNLLLEYKEQTIARQQDEQGLEEIIYVCKLAIV